MPLNANFIRLFSAFSLLISTCRGNNTPAHSPLNYTRPHDVPLDRLLTVDTSMFAAPANIIGGNCTAPTQSLIRDGSLTVILSPTIHENSTKSFDFIQANAIGGSLPYLFEQLGVKADCIPDLVKRGTPLFKDIVNAALSGAQNVSGTTSLSRRGFLSDIGDFFEDVGEAIVDGVEDLVDGVGSILTSGACEVFAASALPGYHASAFGFIILNLLNPPQPTTPDQEFYIHALHGNILQDGIKFYYRAGFPTGFGDAIGVTMGRNVYIRASRIADVSQAGFQYVTETVLHELAHVKQYRSVGYDLSSFGLQYLFNYCKASCSFSILLALLIWNNRLDLTMKTT